MRELVPPHRGPLQERKPSEVFQLRIKKDRSQCLQDVMEEIEGGSRNQTNWEDGDEALSVKLAKGKLHVEEIRQMVQELETRTEAPLIFNDMGDECMTVADALQRSAQFRETHHIGSKEEDALRRAAGQLFETTQFRHSTCERFLQEAERRVEISESVLSNMSKLSEMLPSNIIDFQVVPKKSSQAMQTEQDSYSGFGRWRPGWIPSMPSRFILSEKPRLEDIGSVMRTIQDIFLERIAYAASRDFEDAQPTARPTRTPRGKSSKEAKGEGDYTNEMLQLIDPAKNLITGKPTLVSARRNTKIDGDPEAVFGISHFPDFVYAYFVRRSARQQFPVFITSVIYYAAETKNIACRRRIRCFLRLCQLPWHREDNQLDHGSEDIIDRISAHRMFSILAWVVKLMTPTRFQKLFAGNMLAASNIQGLLSDNVQGPYSNILVPTSAVTGAVSRGVRSLTKYQLREFQRQIKDMTDSAGFGTDTNLKHPVELDAVIQGVLSVLRMVHDQQLCAFMRLYARLKYQHQVLPEQELNPAVLKRSVSLMGGVNIHDAVFYRWYSLSLIYADAYDAVGTFTPKMFGRLLIEHNICLGRLVSAKRILPMFRAALARLRLVGTIGTIKRKAVTPRKKKK